MRCGEERGEDAPESVVPSGQTHCLSCSTNGTPFLDVLLRHTAISVRLRTTPDQDEKKRAYQLFAPSLSHVLTAELNALEHLVHVLVSARTTSVNLSYSRGRGGGKRDARSTP